MLGARVDGGVVGVCEADSQTGEASRRQGLNLKLSASFTMASTVFHLMEFQKFAYNKILISV